MARRTTKQAEAESSTTTTEAPEEAAVTTTENEAAEQPTEEATSTEAPTENKEVDLSTFQAAAKEAVENSDESTGQISVEGMAKVVEQYRLIDGIKGKNKAKAWLNAQMKESMNEDSIQRARAYLQLHDGMSAGAKSATEKVPADPTEAFVQRTTVLKLANSLLLPGDGVTDDWADKANALFEQLKPLADEYFAWSKDTSEDKGEEPEVNPLVKAAVKLSQGKAAKVGGGKSGGSTYSGERRDIAAHITEAFADQEVGTFLTVAEIRKFRSNEYGDSPPSAGAISARLFPGGDGEKNTVKGTRSDTNEKGIKGAVKTDDA
jgi:hypothetical protein